MLKTVKLLLPALIPSWRFFDTIAPSPRIEFTLLKTAQEIPERWQEFRPRPARLAMQSMLKRMVWNPRWNETLFLVSCAERLVENPTEHSTREIANSIKAELTRDGLGGMASYLQFRVVLVNRQDTALQKQITFTSPIYHYFSNMIT